MSERYLITQSLLSSWLYQYDAKDSEAAQEEFLRVLRREETPQTPAMFAGIEFEDNVTLYLRSGIGAVKERYIDEDPPKHNEDYIRTVETMGNKIRGAQLQVPVSIERQLCGKTFLLYGRLDALKAGVIYDVKYVKSYNTGKYFHSPQHPMYLTCLPQAREFRYVISDGKDVFEERYTRAETQQIERTIADFMRYLEEFRLHSLYCEKWKSF